MELQPAADVLQNFLTECELKLGQFAPQNISNMLWACATLGVSPGTTFFGSLLGWYVIHVLPYNMQQHYFWTQSTLCKQCCRSPARIPGPASKCMVQGLLNSRCISSTCAAQLCTVWNVLHAGRKFLAAVTSVSLMQLPLFTPQAIKDTLWAMATIGYTPAKPFLQGAADLCLYLMSQFNPQNIANAIWAFAKFGFNPGRCNCVHPRTHHLLHCVVLGPCPVLTSILGCVKHQACLQHYVVRLLTASPPRYSDAASSTVNCSCSCDRRL